MLTRQAVAIYQTVLRVGTVRCNGVVRHCKVPQGHRRITFASAATDTVSTALPLQPHSGIEAIDHHCRDANGLAAALAALQLHVHSGGALSASYVAPLLRYALVTTQNPEMARAVFEWVAKSGMPLTAEIVHYQVMTHLAASDAEAATTLLHAQSDAPCETNSPRVDTYMLVATWLLKYRGKADVAHLFPLQLGKNDPEPARFLLELCMESHLANKRPAEALRAFDVAVSITSPTAFGYNCALQAWAQESHAALRKLEAGKSSRVKFEAERHRTLDAVASILKSMRDRDLELNHVGYNQYLQILCNTGNMEDALLLPEQMAEHGCSPQTATYVHLIQGSVTNNLLEAIPGLVSRMQSHGISPGVEVVGCWLEAYPKTVAKAPSPALLLTHHVIPALQLLDSLRTRRAAEGIFNILLRGLVAESNIQGTVSLLEAMPRVFGIVPSVVTYRTLFFALLGHGWVEEAMHVFRTYVSVFDSDSKMACVVRALKEVSQFPTTHRLRSSTLVQLSASPKQYSWPLAPKPGNAFPRGNGITTASAMDPAQPFASWFPALRACGAPTHSSSPVPFPVSEDRVKHVLADMWAAGRLLGVTRGLDAPTRRMCELAGLPLKQTGDEARRQLQDARFTHHLNISRW